MGTKPTLDVVSLLAVGSFVANADGDDFAKPAPN